MATRHVKKYTAVFENKVSYQPTNIYEWTVKITEKALLDDTIGPLIMLFFKDKNLQGRETYMGSCIPITIFIPAGKQLKVYHRTLSQYYDPNRIFGRYRTSFSDFEHGLIDKEIEPYIGNPDLTLFVNDRLLISIQSPWEIDIKKTKIELEVLELRGHVGPKEIIVAPGKHPGRFPFNEEEDCEKGEPNPAIPLISSQIATLILYAESLQQYEGDGFYDYKIELRGLQSFLTETSSTMSSNQLTKISRRIEFISKNILDLIQLKRPILVGPDTSSLNLLDQCSDDYQYDNTSPEDQLNAVEHFKKVEELKTVIDWIADLHASGAYPDADTQLIAELQSHYKSLSGDLLLSRELDEITLRVGKIFQLIKVKTYKITVNAQERITVLNELTYDQIVRMAHTKPPSNPNIVFTITYQGGKGKGHGELTSGQTVKIKEGMVFNLSVTSN